MRLADLSWAAYVAGHPERLPQGSGATWAGVSRPEYRRVTRNWRRWQRRRRARPPEPVRFEVRGDELVVVEPRRRR